MTSVASLLGCSLQRKSDIDSDANDKNIDFKIFPTALMARSYEKILPEALKRTKRIKKPAQKIAGK